MKIVLVVRPWNSVRFTARTDEGRAPPTGTSSRQGEGLNHASVKTADMTPGETTMVQSF